MTPGSARLTVIGGGRRALPADRQADEEHPQAHGHSVKNRVAPDLRTETHECLVAGEDLSHERRHSSQAGNAEYAP